MQEAIDQIMRTYGMMFNLSPSEEQSAREMFLLQPHLPATTAAEQLEALATVEDRHGAS